MRSHIGSRRSFICRIKIGPHQPPIDLSQSYQTNSSTPNGNSSSTASNPPAWSSGSRPARNRNTLLTNMDAATSEKPLYSVLHITGYTKVWPPNQMANTQANMYQQQGLDDQQQMPSTNFHLIAIARIQMTSAPADLVNSSNFEFVTRHDQNGLVTFVDQRFVYYFLLYL
jgi:hypothetical protein